MPVFTDKYSFTFFFDEVFENYEEWQEYIETLDIVDYTSPVQSAFDAFCYGILARHYKKVNIRYYVIDEFKEELALVYKDKFDEFLQEKKLVDAIHALTLEEIQQANETIANVANNPNDAVTNPRQPLNYISAQTYSSTNNNKLSSYLTALNNIPSLQIFRFLKGKSEYSLSFDDLFMQVVPNQVYFYERGSN